MVKTYTKIVLRHKTKKLFERCNYITVNKYERKQGHFNAFKNTFQH